MKRAVVIGAGFAGLSAACFLAKSGVAVTVLEKNSGPGGRAQVFREEGFVFDAGPSWYWMPDVFERFFGQFGKTPGDYYDLVRLDPSYQVVWDDETIHIPADRDGLRALFERLEPGTGAKLDAFLKEAEYKYEQGIGKLVYKPGLSPLEFMRGDVLRSMFRIDLLQSVSVHVRKFFTNPKLLQLVEFPVLFLGALPQNTPALYTLMNWADMAGGTWYPMGGMGEIAQGMYRLAQSLGVQFRFEEEALTIVKMGGYAAGVKTAKDFYGAHTVIAACDYHHTETMLLPEESRNYSDRYWDTRAMAPSCLLYYIGVRGKIDGLLHHNLFFDAPFDKHAAQLYTTPQWPDEPLLYACCPSKTDSSVAPKDCENLFLLIPVAPGLKDTPEIRDWYLNVAIERLERRTGVAFSHRIVYQKSFAHRDFVEQYHSFRGNAYGLANTLRQTAFLKPSLRNKKVPNLFYAGQLTVPGPGVPPALISGELAAAQALKALHRKTILA
jgi:phytoene desaturase